MRLTWTLWLGGKIKTWQKKWIRQNRIKYGKNGIVVSYYILSATTISLSRSSGIWLLILCIRFTSFWDWAWICERGVCEMASNQIIKPLTMSESANEREQVTMPTLSSIYARQRYGCHHLFHTSANTMDEYQITENLWENLRKSEFHIWNRATAMLIFNQLISRVWNTCWKQMWKCRQPNTEFQFSEAIPFTNIYYMRTSHSVCRIFFFIKNVMPTSILSSISIRLLSINLMECL